MGTKDKGYKEEPSIKTPTNTGAEVVIKDKRVSVKQMAITFIHRHDGYAYGFTRINSE